MSSPKSRASSQQERSRSSSQTDTGILPPEHWRRLTECLEEMEDDGDSAIEDDNVSSTASLASSILRYRTINGRIYHSERGSAQYWATIDDEQNNALGLNHHVLTLLLDNKLFLAPIKPDIQKVVDIGTGTGIWAIDFADKYSGASIIGTDIAPIQPEWVPPNLEFHIEDCTQPWTFTRSSIDYVHMRWLVGSVADWYSLFEEAFESLKAGGYVESLEPSPRLESDDDTVAPASAMSQWGRFFVEGGRAVGRSFTVLEDDLQRKAMEAAGFVDIEVRDFKNPVGSWPKDDHLRQVGMYTRGAFEADPEGTVLFMASQVGWTREEVNVYLVHLRRELRSEKIHAYFRQRVVWGRKPVDAA